MSPTEILSPTGIVVATLPDGQPKDWEDVFVGRHRIQAKAHPSKPGHLVTKRFSRSWRTSKPKRKDAIHIGPFTEEKPKEIGATGCSGRYTPPAETPR